MMVRRYQDVARHGNRKTGWAETAQSTAFNPKSAHGSNVSAEGAIADNMTWSHQQVSEHTRMRMETPYNNRRLASSSADARNGLTDKP